MSRRIAFINEKGGSAKTTLVANLAAHLALHRGRRVLALDMDPQGQLARALGTELPAGGPSAVDLLLDEMLDDDALDRAGPARGVLPRVATRIRGLDLVGANKALGLAGALEPAGEEATARLSRSLDGLFERDDYDLLLIDAPPSFGPLTLNVLRAVREVVVPVPLTWLGLDGCAALLRTIETVRTRYGNPGLRITMVIPTFYRRTRMAHELLDRLKARTHPARVDPRRVLLDPGIGFGKRYADNIALLRGLEALRAAGRPLLVGASRKRFLGRILDEPVADRRLEGDLAVAAFCRAARVEVLRVHDVRATRRVFRTLEALDG
ncbi:MAG: AAA family ATPase, partial [Myxococcota bacterium]